MARKSDLIPINNESLDRRVKLTSEEKKEIHANVSGLSQRSLAKDYGVSRRTIQFILDPQKLIDNKKRRAERGGTAQYYDKEKHRVAMKDHRDYKKKLFSEGKIVEPKKLKRDETRNSMERGSAERNGKV